MELHSVHAFVSFPFFRHFLKVNIKTEETERMHTEAHRVKELNVHLKLRLPKVQQMFDMKCIFKSQSLACKILLLLCVSDIEHIWLI